MPRIILLVILGVTFSVRAAEAPAARPADADALVQKLGSDDFETRSAAHKALLEMGAGAVEALKKATASKDPEVQQRATDVLIAMEQASVDKPATVIDSLIGGPADQCEKILKTKQEFNAFIDTCTNDEQKKKLKDAAVDFDKEALIVMAVGDIWYQPKSASITVEKTRWVVHYTIEQLFGDFRKDISHPFLIIRVPATNKPVEFDKTTDKCKG